jgi:predicted transcriptional regulator
MARSKLVPIADPEAFIRHNIRVWQDMGYQDWQIGNALMNPRLKTIEDFGYWGLRWSPPPSMVIPSFEDISPDTRHLRLASVLEDAIEGTVAVSRSELCRRAVIGSDTFKQICIDHPDIYAQWEAMKRLNRERRTDNCLTFLKTQRERREQLDLAAAILDRAIERQQHISMTELSITVGRSRSWLHYLCKGGNQTAQRLRDRLKAHCRQLKLNPSFEDISPDTRHLRLASVLEDAIEGTTAVSRSELCRRAVIGSDTFKQICVDYPAIYAQWETMKRLNRERRTDNDLTFLKTQRERREQLDLASAILDRAIERQQHISMTELSTTVGRSRSWLHYLCKGGNQTAQRLRDRLKAHCRQLKLNAQQQSA